MSILRPAIYRFEPLANNLMWDSRSRRDLGFGFGKSAIFGFLVNCIEYRIWLSHVLFL